MDALLNKVIENIPLSIIVFLMLIYLIVFITIKIHRFYLKLTNSLILVEKHDEAFNKFVNYLGVLDDMKSSIRKIEEYIIRNDSTALEQLIRKCSPFKITNFGEVLLNVSEGRDCVDNNIDFFISEIEKMKPLVALDVENYSLTVLNENTKSEMFNNIKDFVFNAPSNFLLKTPEGNEIEIPIKMENILWVMSIYLRDKYFETHPEINIMGFFKES
jgi:hypothetical protein